MENERIFHDHKVRITDRWTFEVSGPLFSEPLDTHSLGGAEDAIRSAERAAALEKKADAVLNISALDEKGSACVVRGVHSGHGTLTGVPKDTAFVYPQVSFIREALQRVTALRDEIQRLESQTRPFSVKVRRSYGRIKPEDYESFVNDFKKEFGHKELTAKGRQAALK